MRESHNHFHWSSTAKIVISISHLHRSSTANSPSPNLQGASRIASCEGHCNRQLGLSVFRFEAPKGSSHRTIILHASLEPLYSNSGLLSRIKYGNRFSFGFDRSSGLLSRIKYGNRLFFFIAILDYYIGYKMEIGEFGLTHVRRK